jgi:hypothetical protein
LVNPSDCGNLVVDLGGVSAEQAVKRRYLVQPSDLFGYADGSQQIAPPSMCPDDAQYRVPGGKFVVKREQSRRCRITRRLPILARTGPTGPVNAVHHGSFLDGISPFKSPGNA